MTKKRSVSSIYLNLSLSLSTLIVVLVGVTLIILNTQHHNKIVEQISGGVSGQLKEAIAHQVDSSVKLANEVHQDAIQALQEKLAREVRQAHQQASKILKNNTDLPRARQQELIIDTLRPIRFNNGHGSVFIVDTNGTSILAGSPEAKTPLTDKAIQRIKDQDELYAQGLTPGAQDALRSSADSTIFFYKYLEPLNWIIGTKESITLFEKETKEQLLGILSKLKTNKRLRLFVADAELNLLAIQGKTIPPEELGLYQVLPENRALVNEAVQLAKNNENEVIQAKWFDQISQQYDPVLLYMSLEPNWNWIIGSFVTLSDIEQEIGLNKSRITDRVEDQITDIAIILLVAYAIAVIGGVLVYRKIQWHFNLFIERLQHAAHDNQPISGEMISIKEFDALAQTMNQQMEKRAVLQAELERLAQKDPLTDLYNRRRMDEILADEVARTNRNQRPFSLILCDIDHFKKVNDTYGHETGDQVICAVADILRTSLREQDAIARWGGEEFLIALPDTGVEHAKKVAEKIRVACENHTVSHAGQSIRFTLTFGVEEFDGAKDIKAAIAAADQALYQGKHQGRNVVICNQS
ncbi:diguanylate cyclase [Alkalimarinus coralli]|uniref:sensor domain-containing diguanylate cyclase n=1 Tax=Alkalimarinus coralli TaxID=2935863 RepID=UPI00202B17CC|nr:diguanylate cyclase [Alkalimarinus coralli]